MSAPHDDTPGGPVGPDRSRVGFLLTVAGFLVVLAWILDRVAPLPVPLPRLWFLHRNLLGMTGLAAALAGLALQRDRTLRGPGSGTAPPDGWTPRIPGRRFESLVIYTRPGCHLCDDALDLLADYSPWLPPPEEIDIDPHPALKARHGEWIPVVEIDGRERFRGRIDEPLLRRLIDNTPPLDQIPPGPRFRPESNS